MTNANDGSGTVTATAIAETVTTRFPAADPSTVQHAPLLPRDGSRLLPLDGLRGLAVLGVLLIHGLILSKGSSVDKAVSAVLEYGWIGVDLFFTLSGFLITGILLDSRSSQHYFRNFYMRRVLRIFPLYYAFLAGAFVIVPMLGWGPLTKAIGDPGPAWPYVLYISNLVRADTGEPTALGHLWSLAIEEQFYIVWPAVVLFLPRRGLMWLCGALLVVSLSLRILLYVRGHSWLVAYNLTPCRIDGMAIGAWIAAAARGPLGLSGLARPALIATAIGIASFGAIFALRAVPWWPQGLGRNIYYTPIDLIAGGILVSALLCKPGQWRFRLFTHPVLVSMGGYSYAIYLLHTPIFAMLENSRFADVVPTVAGSELPRQMVFYVVAIASAYTAGFVSWHVYEKHFLGLKRFFPSATRR